MKKKGFDAARKHSPKHPQLYPAATIFFGWMSTIEFITFLKHAFLKKP
jgi:hypothetical protein